MCYRHATISFDRPCPECGAPQCNQSMYCSECGAEMPYVAFPEHIDKMADYSDAEEDPYSIWARNSSPD